MHVRNRGRCSEASSCPPAFPGDWGKASLNRSLLPNHRRGARWAEGALRACWQLEDPRCQGSRAEHRGPGRSFPRSCRLPLSSLPAPSTPGGGSQGGGRGTVWRGTWCPMPPSANRTSRSTASAQGCPRARLPRQQGGVAWGLPASGELSDWSFSPPLMVTAPFLGKEAGLDGLSAEYLDGTASSNLYKQRAGHSWWDV